MTTENGTPVRFTTGNWIALVLIGITLAGFLWKFGETRDARIESIHRDTIREIAGIASDVREIRVQQESGMRSLNDRIDRLNQRLDKIEGGR